MEACSTTFGSKRMDSSLEPVDVSPMPAETDSSADGDADEDSIKGGAGARDEILDVRGDCCCCCELEGTAEVLSTPPMLLTLSGMV